MQRPILSLLSMLAVVVAWLPAYGQTPDRPGYWHGGWEWGWGHMLFGSVMMIMFWGGLILVIVLAVRWFGSSSAKSSPRRTSLEILEERFARGEIDKEDFEERKRLLSD